MILDNMSVKTKDWEYHNIQGFFVWKKLFDVAVIRKAD